MAYAIVRLYDEDLTADQVLRRHGLVVLVPKFNKRIKLSKHVARRLGHSHELRSYPLYSGYGFMSIPDVRSWLEMSANADLGIPGMLGFLQYRRSQNLAEISDQKVEALMSACRGGVYDDMGRRSPSKGNEVAAEAPAAAPSLQELVGKEVKFDLFGHSCEGKATSCEGDRLLVEVNGLRLLLPAENVRAA